MDNAEKKQLLENAIKTLISEKRTYICTAIGYYTDLHPFNLFPELLKYKPENKQPDYTWWPCNEEYKKLRISILEEIKKNYDN